MEWTISVIVLSLWFIGITMPYTLHGRIHLLLVLAVVVIIVPVLFRAVQKMR
jgi:uncharacterized protein DUF5670